MKTRMLIVAIATLMLGFTSCKKDRNDPNPTNNNGTTQSGLDASKTAKIKKGEPVSFKFSQAPEGSTVIWTVVPFDNVQINPTGNLATIQFSNAGVYSVNASYSNFKGSTNVSVLDSIYNPGSGTPIYEPLTGDQIFITVSATDSMGFSGLIFRYITEKNYQCLNHTLLFDNNFSGQNLQVVFKSVMIPSIEYCTSGEDNASGATCWFPITDGNNGFEVILDGKTYTGSFRKNGGTYTFTWPYTSGVTITPLVIN
ncbi:MAG: hypothetical protein WCI71_10440 [Bacteroidota bacterium]